MSLSLCIGKSFCCSVLAFVCLATHSLHADVQFAHSYAVVVGIGTYSSANWKHLDYARADAKAVADLLKHENYQVTELYDGNATRHNILAALDDLSTKLKADDRVVVFIASHGSSKTIGPKKFGYIVPYDGTDFASYVSDAELASASNEMQTARAQIFIIDACYGGLMVTRSGGVSPDIPGYLDEVTRRIARDIITAGGGDQEVLDTGPNGHSVFTNALLKGLGGDADFNRDGFITFAELEAYIKPLASNAYQTPSTGVLPGHEGGEYVFVSPLGGTPRVEAKTMLPSIALRGSDSQTMSQAKDLLKASRFADALPLIRSAAENGDPEGMAYLGEAYGFGWGLPQNNSEAVNWYRKAANAGNAHGMTDLGSMYLYGLGVAQDNAQAVNWYRKAADAGNAIGMAYLGFMCENGLGVAQDYVQAVSWYRKAADAGNAIGMASLGSAYLRGLGVAQDYVQAMNWSRKAADAGDATGMANLGYLYENGLGGVAQDYAQAVSWYRKAADAGNATGMASLGSAYLRGLGVAQDYAQAMNWCRKAADAGDANAMANLGVMYEFGLGVAKDYAQAMNWYRKAARLGNQQAKNNLARLGESQ